YQSAYKTNQAVFYNNSADNIADDLSPWDSAIYEASPLGRLLQQGSVGAAFQPGTGHTQLIDYCYNDANEVRRFNSDGSSSSFYPANTLYKIKSTNANGNHIISYRDAADRVILKKEQLDEVIGAVTVDYLETYYIYNE